MNKNRNRQGALQLEIDGLEGELVKTRAEMKKHLAELGVGK